MQHLDVDALYKLTL